MATTDSSNYYLSYSTTTADYAISTPYNYFGTATYEIDHDGYIKVDKGNPDKARFVIFYAVEDKDPMIFCKNKKELDAEMKKLMKRKDVDKASIRVFSFNGGVKKL